MQDSYLIIGLGNPGKKYASTRHNCGFMVVDRLARQVQCDFSKKKLVYLCKTVIADKPVILAKPRTFMNLSGNAAHWLLHYYHIDLDNLLVVYDDMDLPLAKLRLKGQGGAGGHNGIASIITHLGSSNFARLRCGIGRAGENTETVNFVLSPFSKQENKLCDEMVVRAADAVTSFIRFGIEQTMNQYNTAQV